MREILFRGKRVDNGEWVEGGYYLEPYTDYVYIVCWNSFGMGFTEYIKVDPATVGQFIGMKDQNGRRIFEGDVIRYIYEPGKGFWNANQLSVIRYGKTGYTFDGIMGTNKYALMCGCMSSIPFNQEADNIPEFEVIGNIHDNPELMEVQ